MDEHMDEDERWLGLSEDERRVLSAVNLDRWEPAD